VCLNVYAVYKLVQGQTHLGYALPCATDYGPLELKAKAALIVKMSHDDDVVSTAIVWVSWMNPSHFVYRAGQPNSLGLVALIQDKRSM
jgi:hypothetical protein